MPVKIFDVVAPGFKFNRFNFGAVRHTVVQRVVRANDDVWKYAVCVQTQQNARLRNF